MDAAYHRLPDSRDRCALRLNVDRGYIKLFRRIQENELWQEKPFDRARAWIDLLFLTNYKPGGFWLQGIFIKVERGQVGWSENRLAERWGWSRGRVQRFFKLLKKRGKVEQTVVQADKRLKSVYTLINYEQYQGDSTSDRTGGGQATDKRRDSKKKDKKEKKVKKKAYGEFKNVFLTDEDYKKLETEYPKKEMLEAIEEFSAYMASRGKVYKNHLATLRPWLRKKGVAKIKICTAKEPAPKDAKGWKHPNTVSVKRDNLTAKRCVHCKKIIYL